MSKNYFWNFFSDSKVKKIGFSRSATQTEISEKNENFRKSAPVGRTSCGTHPKPVFSTLGGPCGQNEAYTSLVRPFLRKLCCSEDGAFLVDSLEIPFWSICECAMPATKNLGFWRNYFFAYFFSRKCFLCSWLLEKKVCAYENHFWSFYNTLKFEYSKFARIFRIP